ncbi:MAG TPA: PrgI family protein [Candidatus Dormibacteraeota bacterium]
MPARIPLDVDLEDRLIYGLTPQRFGYAAVALLAAMAAWHSLPGLSGPMAAILIGVVGVGLAWGRFGGRGFDAWLLSILRYGLRNYRIEFNREAVAALRRRRPRLVRPPRRPPSQWTPRRARPSLPAPSLQVLGRWESDP